MTKNLTNYQSSNILPHYQEKYQYYLKLEYTILIIAHRLSTVINADKIMLLDKGKIDSIGTHKQLLETSEKYRKLYETELLDDKNNSEIEK